MLRLIIGSSTEMANPAASIFSATPGPEDAVTPLRFVAHLCPFFALCSAHPADPHIIGQQYRVQWQYFVQMATVVGVRGEQEPTQAVALLNAIDWRTQDVHLQLEAFGQIIAEEQGLGEVVSRIQKIDRDGRIDLRQDV